MANTHVIQLVYIRNSQVEHGIVLQNRKRKRNGKHANDVLGIRIYLTLGVFFNIYILPYVEIICLHPKNCET